MSYWYLVLLVSVFPHIIDLPLLDIPVPYFIIELFQNLNQLFNVHLMSYVLEWTVKTLSYIVNEYWVDYAHVHVII